MKTRLFARHLPIMLVLIAALAIGIVTVKQYGESWDEADIQRYSAYAIDAYGYIAHPADLPSFDTNLNLYGPGYYVAVNRIARGLVALVPSWSILNAWHLVYFVTYLGGALSLYVLASRWLSVVSALGATLLFLSQPLMWGHAFINPKDIPFMALFTAAVCTGFVMIDRWNARPRIDAVLLIAGALAGLTSSFRVLGPLAALMVLGYAAHRLRQRMLAPAVAYLVTTLAVAYLSWPYLWAAPVSRYFESISTMAQFPFASSILFADHLFKADQLPRTYFPVLLGIQLTEPAILLICAGLVVSVCAALRKRASGPLALFVAWFLVPTTIVVSAGSPLYDNARQLYFLLPPLFIIAGVALDQLFSMLTSRAAQMVLLLAATLPGFLLTMRLHPYEYVYYNAIVGGTGGAYRHFEMDYWGLSFREVSEYLNAHASRGASVLVYGPQQLVEHQARPDIHVHIPGDGFTGHLDFVLFLTRANVDERRCKDTEPIFSVGRRGAVFSVLKSVPQDSKCN